MTLYPDPRIERISIVKLRSQHVCVGWKANDGKLVLHLRNTMNNKSPAIAHVDRRGADQFAFAGPQPYLDFRKIEVGGAVEALHIDSARDVGAGNDFHRDPLQISRDRHADVRDTWRLLWFAERWIDVVCTGCQPLNLKRR